MVVFNRGKKKVDLDLTRFTERLNQAETATDVITGKSYNFRKSLTLEPRSVLLLEVSK
jgi:hypothetical protein